MRTLKSSDAFVASLSSSEERYRALVSALAERRPGEIITVPRETLVPRPRAWRLSVGVPYGRAILQWRDGVVHVHETRSHFHLHRDTVAAHAEPLRHLREDAPHVVRALATGAVVLGAALLAVLLG